MAPTIRLVHSAFSSRGLGGLHKLKLRLRGVPAVQPPPTSRGSGSPHKPTIRLSAKDLAWPSQASSGTVLALQPPPTSRWTVSTRRDSATGSAVIWFKKSSHPRQSPRASRTWTHGNGFVDAVTKKHKLRFWNGEGRAEKWRKELEDAERELKAAAALVILRKSPRRDAADEAAKVRVMGLSVERMGT